jgi:hypothetical protein
MGTGTAAAAAGIAEFWSWWPAARGRIQGAIEGAGFDDALVDEIAAHVAAIRSDLDWEVAPGSKARHAFCLSGKGNPELRRISERWLRAAPAIDQTWEYHPARRANPELDEASLEMDGFVIALGDFVAAFDVDEGREVVNVRCFHPAFPRMSDELRGSATFLMLDGALGEDGVERWLGAIEGVAAAPDGARPIAELRAAIDVLARTATGERFAVMRGNDAEGRPLFVTLNTALKRIDHLACDNHVVIDMAILNPDANGLTTSDEAKDLDAIEDELQPLLTDAVYFGRETRAGRRVLHFFAPGDSPARERLAAWASAHGARDVRIDWRDDPRWEARARFL